MFNVGKREEGTLTAKRRTLQRTVKNWYLFCFKSIIFWQANFYWNLIQKLEKLY